MLSATHSAEALNRAAGVNVQRGSGQESLIAIRSPVLTGAGGCGSFLLLEDGLPLRPTGFCNVNALFEANIEQASAIEIIKGPAVATYGANATHGIVNVLSGTVSALPRAAVTLESGSHDYRRVRFASAAASNWGAYGHWTRDGGDREAAGFDEAKLNLLADFDAGDGALQLRAAGTVLNQETAGFIRGRDAYRDPLRRRSNPNPEAFRDARSTRLAAAWSAQDCEGCFIDVRGVLRHSEMQFSQHFLLGKPVEENGQTSFAISASRLRPVGTAVSLRWGAEAERARSELLEFQAGPTLDGSAAARAIRPAGRHYDYVVHGAGLGAFADLEWQINDRLRAGAALRADWTRYDYDNLMLDGNTDDLGQPCPGGCLYSRPGDRRDDFVNFAPKFDLRWRPSERQTLYAAATRGFRPPEITELYRLQRQQQLAELDSERLDSLELGWLLESPQFRAQLAAFAMQRNQIILRDAEGFNVSGGRTRHQGVEYQLLWQPQARWSLRAAGSFASHEYAFSRVSEGNEAIVPGNQIDTAPRVLTNLQLGWQPAAAVRSEIEFVHVGGYYVDAANQNRYPGHVLANLRVSVTPRPELRATLRVTNLADRRYADRADFAQGDYRYFPGRERSFFLELQWRRDR